MIAGCHGCLNHQQGFLYWLVNRDPYHNLLESLHNWVGFNPLNTVNNQGPFLFASSILLGGCDFLGMREFLGSASCKTPYGLGHFLWLLSIWYLKQTCFDACFSWMMVPKSLNKKRLEIVKHPLKYGCLGFQVLNNLVFLH